MALFIFLSFIVGFIIGGQVNFPPANEAKIAGTIGKVNNYRNVKISENDLELRNELMSNEVLLTQYRKYLSFHYLNSTRQMDELRKALDAGRSTPEFAASFPSEIAALDRLQFYLEEARKDILIAISALQNIADTDQQNIGLLISNAGNVITQINYRGQEVIDYTVALAGFLKTHEQGQFPELKKAHDLLLLSQVKSAVISNDKPRLKYLDKRELLSSKPELLQLVGSEASLMDQVNKDMESLGLLVPDQERLLVCLDMEKLGVFTDNEKLNVAADNEKLNVENATVGLMDLEKLGVVWDQEKLGYLVDSEKLGLYVGDSEKLNLNLNAEKLGLLDDVGRLEVFCNAEKLGVIVP